MDKLLSRSEAAYRCLWPGPPNNTVRSSTASSVTPAGLVLWVFAGYMNPKARATSLWAPVILMERTLPRAHILCGTRVKVSQNPAFNSEGCDGTLASLGNPPTAEQSHIYVSPSSLSYLSLTSALCSFPLSSLPLSSSFCFFFFIPCLLYFFFFSFRFPPLPMAARQNNFTGGLIFLKFPQQ